MFLFVYGTLRHKYHGEMANRLAEESEWIGPAIVENAELYRIKGEQFDYPAMILLPKSKGVVYGDIFRLLNPSITLNWLDEYEECGPKYSQPNEYLRMEIEAKLMMNEEKLAVIAYIWNWPIQNEKCEFVEPVIGRIDNGDWLLEEENVNGNE